MTPHPCPNCKGTGIVIPTTFPCFTCGGTGTIWELTQEEMEEDERRFYGSYPILLGFPINREGK